MNPRKPLPSKAAAASATSTSAVDSVEAQSTAQDLDLSTPKVNAIPLDRLGLRLEALRQGDPILMTTNYSESGVVSIKIAGDIKVASAGGGGYDKAGAAFGEFLEKNFQGELQTLFKGLSKEEVPAKRYGAALLQNGQISLDGACGFDSMRSILEDIGFTLSYVGEPSKSSTAYLLNRKKEPTAPAPSVEALETFDKIRNWTREAQWDQNTLGERRRALDLAKYGLNEFVGSMPKYLSEASAQLIDMADTIITMDALASRG